MTYTDGPPYSDLAGRYREVAQQGIEDYMLVDVLDTVKVGQGLLWQMSGWC